MSKVSVELVHETLANNELTPEQIQKILQELEAQAAAEAEAEKANREPPIKKQFAIIISDPRGVLPDEDFVGWVAQILEDTSPGDLLDSIIRAAYEYNVSKKGRKYPVKTIGEACEAVGQRYMKEQNVTLKTKTPVTIIRTNNRIPEIEDDFPTK